MKLTLVFALAPMLLLASHAPLAKGRPGSTARSSPLCPGGRAPMTDNLRLDRVPSGRLDLASPGTPGASADGGCLGLASAAE